jgi:hypothetical protein
MLFMSDWWVLRVYVLLDSIVVFLNFVPTTTFKRCLVLALRLHNCLPTLYNLFLEVRKEKRKRKMLGIAWLSI